MNRLVVSLLVAAVVPVIGVAADATPAHACSCLASTDADAFARADAVFVGRLIGYEVPRRPTSSLAPAVWKFKVRDVYKGKVLRKQEVVSAVSGASCGLEIPERGTFLVFANTASSNRIEPRPAKGQLQANLCGGTRAFGGGVLDPSLGEPHAPRGLPSKHR